MHFAIASDALHTCIPSNRPMGIDIHERTREQRPYPDSTAAIHKLVSNMFCNPNYTADIVFTEKHPQLHKLIDLSSTNNRSVTWFWQLLHPLQSLAHASSVILNWGSPDNTKIKDQAKAVLAEATDWAANQITYLQYEEYSRLRNLLAPHDKALLEAHPETYDDQEDGRLVYLLVAMGMLEIFQILERVDDSLKEQTVYKAYQTIMNM